MKRVSRLLFTGGQCDIPLPSIGEFWPRRSGLARPIGAAAARRLTHLVQGIEAKPIRDSGGPFTSD